ncbi:MAG: hypothetical protein WDA18_00880 [Candidatus Ratteibacteria bacterium]|jgi:phosphomannomutase
MEEKLIISVSGIRGIYGKALNCTKALTLGRAFGLFCKGKEIYLGADTRLSGDALKHAFTAGVLEAGNNLKDLGIVPTPVVEFMVEKNPSHCAAVITASHNTQEYNGIKFLGETGTFLNEEEFAEFLALYKESPYPDNRDPGRIEIAPNPFNDFAATLFSLIDIEAIQQRKFHVVVDPCNGVGALYSAQFLENLGCTVTMINDFPPGIFAHNPEPKAVHLTDLLRKVPEIGADIGFAQDPDGDRLVLVDEKGRIADEERGVALLLGYLVERTKKKNPVVVVNHSTSSLVDYACRLWGGSVVRSKVGEVHVVTAMRKVGAIAGGEGSGGIIFPEFHAGRDSFAGMALILECLAKKKSLLSDLLALLPSRSLIKDTFPLPDRPLGMLFAKIEESFPKIPVIREDGLKLLFSEKEWAHIRPSNTEPFVRIYVEAENEPQAKMRRDQIKEIIFRAEKNKTF